MTETINHRPMQEQVDRIEPLFPREESSQYFGIKGDLQSCFEIGESRFGVFQVADNEQGYVKDVFRDEPDTTVNYASHLIVQLDDSFRGGSDHVKALRQDHPEILGRQFLTDRFTYDDSVSRTHAQVELADGRVSVIDLDSLNGTHVLSRTDILAEISSNQEPLITGIPRKLGSSAVAAKVTRPEYAYLPSAMDRHASHAAGVELDELVRVHGNEGKQVDVEYMDNQSQVRQLFVDSMRTGALYGTTGRFEHVLQEAHKLAARGDYYSRVGQGSLGIEPGAFRTEDLENSRIQEALQVAGIARQYGDTYANRFITEGKHSTPIRIEGIDSQDAPFEELEIQDGLVASYTYVYPRHESLHTYIDKMNDIGQQIQVELERAEPDKARAISLIAKQYQLGADARPFNQINNSIFMNLANSQLKLLGLKGVTHGNLDFAAQRLSTETFTDYFLNYTWAQQIQ